MPSSFVATSSGSASAGKAGGMGSGASASAPNGSSAGGTGAGAIGGAGSGAGANATAASSQGGAAASTQIYEAVLAPQNDSGVSGVAVVSQEGNVLNVDVEATGLTPGQIHMQHIHGFTTGQASAAPTPALDSNHDGFVSSTEAESVTGKELLDLTLNPQLAVQQPPGTELGSGTYPTADANGTVHYQETFTFPSGAAASVALQNLAHTGIELHGMNVPAGVDSMSSAGYDPTMPVAFGLLHALTPSSAATALANSIDNEHLG